MPPIRNPFIAGGPVPPERFIGREKEVNAILNRLTQTLPGSSAIYGEARIGKTSLLHYLRSDQVLGDWQISPRDFTFCLLDCGGIDTPFSYNFWRTVVDELQQGTQNAQIARQLADFYLSREQPNQDVNDLCRHLSLSKHRFVLLLDEFENAIRQDSDLLRTLRVLVGEKSTNLVIATIGFLPGLVRDIDLGGGQTFDRPFEIRKLENFSRDETNYLIDQALAGTEVKFDQRDRQFVWDTSQGHPFKVQFACSRIFEDKVFS